MTSSIWVKAVVAVCMICLLSGNALGASDGRATKSVEELIEGMSAFEARFLGLDSWWIEYEHSRKYTEGPQRPDRRLMNARRGGIAFASEEDTTGPNVGEKIWYLWRDNVSVHYDTGAQYLIYPSKHVLLFQIYHYTDKLFLDTYVGDTIVDPQIADQMGGASYSDTFRKFALPHSVVRNQDDFVVRAKLEIVDGDPCHVLELPDKDVLWIDTEHGFICKRRIQYAEPGVKVASWENSDLFEAASGMWLPRTQRRVFYFFENEPAELRGQVRLAELNQLISAKLGGVPLESFVVPRPEHATVIDMVRGKEYVAQKGTENAEEVFDASIRKAALRARGGAEGTGFRRVLILTNLVVLAAIAFFILRHYIRKLRTGDAA
jgi:hypothetical protein